MKFRRLPIRLAVSVLICLTTSISAGEPLISTGFAPIFNGKNLDGWQGDVEHYEVADGILRCKPGKGGTLLTEKEYRNFIARIAFRLPPGGNSGLAIRATLEGDPAYDAMCELQILDSEDPRYAELDVRQYHGSAYGMGDKPHPGKNRSSGFFGIAGHGDPVEFRSIEIKQLP